MTKQVFRPEGGRPVPSDVVSNIDTAISRVLDSPTTNFVELARIAGLDPARDFRFANLFGVDFADSDLSGFDFTGAKLDCANFKGARLSDAKIFGAIGDLRCLCEADDWKSYGSSQIVPCFTPQGRLILLPVGATILDFAYAVHSRLGDTCVGGKIDNRVRLVRTELSHSDQVEILTSRAQTPSPAWEHFVATRKAKAAIRRCLRPLQRAEHLKTGRSLLNKAFHEEGYELTEEALVGVKARFRQAKTDDLVAAVGKGLIHARKVLLAVYPDLNRKRKAGKPVDVGREKTSSGEIAIRGLIPGIAVHFARCCHPLPGDRIVGIITTGKGVTIHTIDCATLESFADAPERWLDVSWDMAKAGMHGTYTGRLKISVANQAGSLTTLSTLIARNHGNITNLRITNRSMDFFDMVIDIDVTDVKHLADIASALRASPVMSDVERERH